MFTQSTVLRVQKVEATRLGMSQGKAVRACEPNCLASIQDREFDGATMIARILALFVGLFIAINLLGNVIWPGFDANVWWIHFGSWMPVWLGKAFLAISGAALIAFAFQNRQCRQRSRKIAVVTLALATVALLNAIGFYWLLATGRIEAGFPVPLSLVICGALIWIGRCAWAEQKTESRARWWMIAAGSVCLFAAFPLALMVFFGNTDYRRPADAVVVFGARAYKDGRLSDALQDRIRTACDLYRAGLAKRLVLSGGNGDGPVTEAEAMRGYALKHGVAAADIFIDNEGVNTEATVRDTTPLFRQWHSRRVLAVSHFYHLPRVKLAYQRAGVEVWTVPARQGRVMGQIPFNMAREVAAFWDYYWKEKPVASPRRA
jgi:vancomycin permeability regulator SanA